MKISKYFIASIYLIFTILMNLNTGSSCEMEEGSGGCCEAMACCSVADNNCCASDHDDSEHATDHLVVQNDRESTSEKSTVAQTKHVFCFDGYFNFNSLESVEPPPPISKKFIRFHRLIFYS